MNPKRDEDNPDEIQWLKDELARRMRAGDVARGFAPDSPRAFASREILVGGLHDRLGLTRTTLPPSGSSPTPLKSPFRVFDKIVEFVIGETSKKVSAAETIGKSIGEYACKYGGRPLDPLIACADCVQRLPDADSHDECLKACRETIEKCTQAKLFHD